MKYCGKKRIQKFLRLSIELFLKILSIYIRRTLAAVTTRVEPLGFNLRVWAIGLTYLLNKG